MNPSRWTVWSSDPKRSMVFSVEGTTAWMRTLDGKVIARQWCPTHARARAVAQDLAVKHDARLAEAGLQACPLCLGAGRFDDIPCARCESTGRLVLEVAR